MTESFAAQIRRFRRRTMAKAEAVFRQSAQDVFEIAQTPTAQGGRMRVDTGFLRNSLVSGLNGSTALTGADSYVLAIAGARLGDTIFGGWTADYARAREYGARGQAPDFYMRGAAQQWQGIVARNARRVAND